MVDIIKFQEMLSAEKLKLESEMAGIAHKNPGIAGDWEPTAPDLNNPTADPNDRADSIQEFEENSAVEVELEARLMEIDAALTRIEVNSYGACRVCKNPIEETRLKANPAAATCITHREG
jgi:DnaK suppressor protein